MHPIAQCREPFLRFQIEDHGTGDSGEVIARR